MLYDNYETFLLELSKMFEAGRTRGNSVFVTMKKYDGRTKRNPRKPSDKVKPTRASKNAKGEQYCGDLMPNEYKCLIRATLGNKKISAAISPRDMNKFQLSYSNLLKGNLYGLKKRPKPNK